MKLRSNKIIRFVASGVFGLMMLLNIMVGLDFDREGVLPSITLVELGNKAYADGEGGGTTNCYGGGTPWFGGTSLPKCETNCPYDKWKDPKQIGKCNF